MIKEQAFEQSIPLALVAANKSLAIYPVENTPLFELVKSTDIGNTAVAVNTEYTGSIDSQIDVRSLEDGSDNIIHNKALDDIVDLLAKSVASHVSVAKNVVTPVVERIANKIIEITTHEIPKLDTYKINIVDLPTPMQNDAFRSSIEKAGGGIYSNPDGYLKHGERSPTALLDMMLTGSKDYDEKIREWYASKGDEFFFSIWNNLFRDINESNPSKVKHFLDFIDSDTDGTDAALAIYLISRKLLDDTPEDTGMTLSQYNKLLNQFKDTAAVKLSREYENNDTRGRTGILVTSVDDRKKEVFVLNKTYTDYITNGGRNEAILGSIISGVIPYNVEKLRSTDIDTIGAWDRYNLFSKTNIRVKALNFFKNTALSVFLNDLADLNEFEKGYVLEHPEHIQKCGDLAQEYINSINDKAMEDVYGFTMNLVTSCRFHYTSAQTILQSIHDITTTNKDIPVREAALIATTEYLIDYLSDQMRLK